MADPNQRISVSPHPVLKLPGNHTSRKYFPRLRVYKRGMTRSAFLVSSALSGNKSKQVI
jgi:hypothetical protein